MNGNTQVSAAGIPAGPGQREGGPGRHYEAPAVTYLGTLHELTLGGTTTPDDGFGGAGGAGSVFN